MTYINGQTSLLKRAEGNDLLEEIKQVISTIRMREVGDRGVTRPGDNRYQPRKQTGGQVQSETFLHDSLSLQRLLHLII